MRAEKVRRQRLQALTTEAHALRMARRREGETPPWAPAGGAVYVAFSDRSERFASSRAVEQVIEAMGPSSEALLSVQSEKLGTLAAYVLKHLDTADDPGDAPRFLQALQQRRLEGVEAMLTPGVAREWAAALASVRQWLLQQFTEGSVVWSASFLDELDVSVWQRQIQAMWESIRPAWPPTREAPEEVFRVSFPPALVLLSASRALGRQRLGACPTCKQLFVRMAGTPYRLRCEDCHRAPGPRVPSRLRLAFRRLRARLYEDSKRPYDKDNIRLMTRASDYERRVAVARTALLAHVQTGQMSLRAWEERYAGPRSRRGRPRTAGP